MKFSTSKDNLMVGLNRIISAVNSKPVYPILSNVLIETVENGVSFTGYDLETKITTVIDAVVESAGRITLPAKKLIQVISGLANDIVQIEKLGEEEVVCVSCKKTYYKMRGLAAIDYPESEEFVQDWGFNVPGTKMVSALSKVAYARSDDENRKALNGILMSIRGGILTVAATDGRRLALVENSFNDQLSKEVEGDIIIPYKVVNELVKSFGAKENLEIKINSTSAKFVSDNTTITTKLVDGVYPNYRSVIPENFNQKVAIPRIAFNDALKQVSCFTNEVSGGVSFNLTASEMQIKSVSTEFGESCASVDIALEGEPINISFNPQYFIEPLKYLECDQLIMKYNDGFSPVALTGDEGFIYIIMPLRG